MKQLLTILTILFLATSVFSQEDTSEFKDISTNWINWEQPVMDSLGVILMDSTGDIVLAKDSVFIVHGLLKTALTNERMNELLSEGWYRLESDSTDENYFVLWSLDHAYDVNGVKLGPAVFRMEDPRAKLKAPVFELSIGGN